MTWPIKINVYGQAMSFGIDITVMDTPCAHTPHLRLLFSHVPDRGHLDLPLDEAEALWKALVRFLKMHGRIEEKT